MKGVPEAQLVYGLLLVHGEHVKVSPSSGQNEVVKHC